MQTVAMVTMGLISGTKWAQKGRKKLQIRPISADFFGIKEEISGQTAYYILNNHYCTVQNDNNEMNVVTRIGML